MITFCLLLLMKTTKKKKPCGIIVPEKRATTTVSDKLTTTVCSYVQYDHYVSVCTSTTKHCTYLSSPRLYIQPAERA